MMRLSCATKGWLGAGFKKEAGQEEMLAGCRADAAADVDDADEVDAGVVKAEEVIKVRLHAFWKISCASFH